MYEFMDLREFLNLFWRYRVLFLGTISIFVMGGFLIQALQPVRFETELTMNVARFGTRATNEYSYDDFYRLQADERFADTVVRWLESPRIVADIAKASTVAGEELIFDADRLSSQVIRVRFVLREEAKSKRVAEALFAVLNRETKSLNQNRSDDGWFMLVGETPSLVDARFGKTRALAVATFLGMFCGFLAVSLQWYRKDSTKKEFQEMR